MSKDSSYAVSIIIRKNHPEEVEKTYVIAAGSSFDAKLNALMLAKNEYMTNTVEVDDYLRIS